MERFVCPIVLGSLLAISACTSAISPVQSAKPPVKVAGCDRGCPPRPTGIPDVCYIDTFEALKISLQTPRKDIHLTPRLSRLNTLAFFAFSTNDNTKTFELINALPSEAEKAETIHLIMGIHYPTSEPAQRTEFLSRVVQLVTTFKDPETKTRSLISLAEKYISLKQPDQAIALLTAALQSAPTIKDVEQQNAQRVKVAANLAELNHLDQAMNVVNRLTTDDSKEEALYLMTRQLAHIGQFQAALKLVSHFPSPDRKSYALIDIAAEYTEINNNQKAVELLAQARQSAQLLKDDEDGQSKASMLNAIVLGYAKAGDDRKVFEVLRTIAPDRRIDDLYDLTHHYLADKKYDQVLQIIQVMREVKADFWVDSTLTDLAHDYIKTGKYDQAVQIANSLKRVPWQNDKTQTMGFDLTPENRKGKLGILTHLATQYAKTGQKQKAINLFKQILQMAKKTASPTELVEIAVSYQATIGDRQTAIALLDQALQKAKIARVESKEFILNIVASGYGRLKQYDRAIQVINFINQSQSQAPDAFYMSGKIADLSSLTIIAAEDGQFQQALKFANLIGSPEEKDSLLSMVAIRAGDTKQYDQGLQIAKLISDRPERDRLLQMLQCAKGKQ